MAVWPSGVLLFVTVIVHVVAGGCSGSKYGYGCRYQCHCPLDNCNSTSGCQSASCSRGWSGPTCQKENVAFNKTTSSSSAHFQPSNAVNGDKRGNDVNRCFHSAFNDNSITFAWWRVDLGNITLVHDVIIHFRTDYKVRRNGIQIYIADTAASPTDGVHCYNVTGNRHGTGIPDVLTATCSGEGRYLVLYTRTVNNDTVNVPVMDFCEVEVEVCAPGTFGNDCDNYCHCEGDACNYVNGTCPSGVCLPGWQTYRCDKACTKGLEYGANCTGNCSTRMCEAANETCPPDSGRCENGCQPGFKGEDCTTACTKGLEYGANCTGNCSTRMCEAANETCPPDSGRCENGCQPGFKGEDCTTACTKGLEYGANCTGNCSTRMCEAANDTCPPDSGRCENGCQPGFKGEDCTTACTKGLEYGANCTGNCSTRMCEAANETCPPDSGRCENGCQPGFKGEDCTTVCVQGTEYGVGCLKNCCTRMCQENTRTCPRDTGRCTDGCLAGWKWKDCTTVCSIGTYGANCSEKCGQCRGSQTCHHVSGACPDGCSDGWTNHTCTQEVSMPLSTSPAVIAGVVVAAIAIVAIGFVVVVFLRRRNHRKQSDNHTKIHKEDTDETGVDNPAPVLGEDEDNVEEDHNATYYNIGGAPAVTVVSVDQLGERIKELQVPAGGFQAEYQKLPTTFTRPYTDSQREENKGKNKYISYYPYDATRVVLKELPDQPGSDYINASYIDGYSRPKAYIAAQAPNKKTLMDFWRMIWERNCTRIVMLTNLKELGRLKCEAYWSDTTDLHVGDFIITVTDSSIRANWVVRELQVTDRQTNTSRCFYHFHFTTWPDHGTPEEMALTEFLWLVRTSYNTQDDPLLVHCSAGVGRTGTYIALDYLLDQALAEDAVDVLGCVSGIRDQRKGMIQTKEQYTCLYMALYDALQFGNTAITIDEFRNNRNVKGTFSTCRMAITKFIETQNTQREKQSKETSVKGQVWINGRSDILAIRLRSHLSMQGYLLTEAPSVTTSSLFWKLTEEQESSTVIVLPDSHQCLSSFVPSPGDSLDLGPVTVTCSTEIPVNTNVTLLNIDRQMENSEPTHVRVYILNILPAQSPSTFLELLEELDRHTGDVNPNTVTVMYSDGGRQNAAMLCILSNIVQGLKYDKRAEIYNNIRAMVHCLDQDITQDDVALCYDVAAIYLESQNIYANL
ncbi:receptor-type tyrosine-protein phosphatase alpha-like isoform X2 [Haliotis asinina]|uniref:receptor-type tyrosine-protein phosphatase alpha-like isoform X2 n=1 Tax=Haliotis asinina TaxID=109174 RepID=UPI003531D137